MWERNIHCLRTHTTLWDRRVGTRGKKEKTKWMPWPSFGWIAIVLQAAKFGERISGTKGKSLGQLVRFAGISLFREVGMF